MSKVFIDQLTLSDVLGKYFVFTRIDILCVNSFFLFTRYSFLSENLLQNVMSSGVFYPVEEIVKKCKEEVISPDHFIVEMLAAV